MDTSGTGAIAPRGGRRNEGIVHTSNKDPLVLVGGVVVHHHVQLAARVGLGDQLEEVEELAVAVARLASQLPSCRLRGSRDEIDSVS
jgi:hypothetical protein